MKNVLITGASGMIGKIILSHCIKETMINEIIVLVRKPLGISHYKVKEIIVKDFEKSDEYADALSGIDVVYFCLGAYTGSVSKEVLKKITVDYVDVFARALHVNNSEATFCLLSGSGADQSEKSKVPFALYKGMIENKLKEIGFGALYIFRPGYIYPVEKRKEPNILYALMRALYPIMRLFGKNFTITSNQLAQFMFLIGMNGSSEEVYENADMLQDL